MSLLTDLFCFDARANEIGAHNVFGTQGRDLPQGSQWAFILPFTTAMVSSLVIHSVDWPLLQLLLSTTWWRSHSSECNLLDGKTVLCSFPT